MKLPSESSSSWVHLTYAVFHWASLVAWSELPDLTEAQRTALTEQATAARAAIDELLREARDTENAQFFDRPLAAARQNVALVLLRRRVGKALALVVNLLCGGSNDHPLVRRFLPNLLSGITGAKIADRGRLITEAAARLAGLEGELPNRDELVTELNDAGRRANEAVEASHSTFSGWSRERSEEVVAKGKLRLELERSHSALGVLFPGQRSFVESFFLKGSKASEGSDDDETTEAAPTEEPTPTTGDA